MALLLVTLAAGGVEGQGRGGRSPAFSPDGRLAVSARGDLWVLAPALDGRATRITSGPAWDRDPVWSADGMALVFASDRTGGVDLYRVDIAADGTASEPVRLTDHPAADHQPAVGPDGTIVFVRGLGAGADLWERTASGQERRRTDETGGEVEPAVSPTGRLAWIEVRDGRRTLRVRDDDGTTRSLHTDQAAAHPAWSPGGDRIAFTTAGANAGVWVTPADGGRLELAARRHAEPAWSPDGERLALGDAPDGDVGYNGDPDRLGDRSAGDPFGDGAELVIVRAPAPVEETVIALDVDGAADRASLNADAYDRAWQRSADLYFADRPDAQRIWESAGDRHRAAALAASDDAELERAIHALLGDRPPLREQAEGRAGVSSAHPLATAAGVEILDAGGNVVDAAVAVSFALGVVEPDASGPGGYGEMLIHLEGMDEPVAIEFMTRLPEAYNASFDEVRAGGAHGALLANVPGTVAGMESAWKRFGSGRLPWSRLLEPAIRLADDGFPISRGLATTLSRERESFARYESSRALFFRDGEPMQAGDTLRNPDLAWTLRQIAQDGADAFYRGAVAERLVEDLRAHGSAITRDDLRRYFAADRRPVRTTYRGHDVYSGPPPVTGGVGLVAKLNLLEHVRPGPSITGDAATLHAMLEAWKLQPSTGGRIADPDLWPTDVGPFESKDTAAARWRCFDARRALDDDAIERGCATADGAGGDAAPTSSHDTFSEDADDPCAARAEPRGCRNTGTTSYAVADADGNAVAVTQTLGTWGGTFYVTPGLGFLYNDKYMSYRSDPDAYGTRLPYARNTTIIQPTIVYDGSGPDARPLAALGAAGNAWITSAVYAMVVGIVDYDMGPQEALELPRMLPGGGGVIQIEDGFAPDAIERLEAMGHRFRRISLKGELRMGYGAAVVVREGRVIAGADPRRAGAAGAAR